MNHRSLCGLLFLSSLLASVPAHATQAVLSSPTTDSSQVMISGTSDPATVWVWAQIVKSDGSAPNQDFFPKIVNHAFSEKLYVKGGPGAYQIKLLETSNPVQYGSSYFEVMTLNLTNTDSTDHEYSFPSPVVQSDDPSIIALSQTIISGLPQNSADMDKSRALHDWVATHITYDVAAADSNILGDQSALTTLQTSKGVCSGYARLNAALQRAAGLPVRLIDGTAIDGDTSGSHEWDEVLINGQWIIEDPTWDAGGVENGVFIFRLVETYFNPDPTVFAKNHIRLKVKETE